MDYVTLGSSGLQVSRLCLGCMSFGSPGVGNQGWALDGAAAQVIMERAIAAGINFFDTANVYSGGVSEEVTGAILRKLLPREQAVIATKVGLATTQGSSPNSAGLSRKHILLEIDKSLKRLGVDYIDLYIVHRFDPRTPLEETMSALNDIVQSGKARYLGASTMHAYQFVEMQAVARSNGWQQFISMQNLYNLAWREEEVQMNTYCIRTGVGITPWSPLGYGFLATDWRETGRLHSERGRRSVASSRSVVHMFGTDEDYKVLDALAEVASELDRPKAQVALAWLLGRPGIAAPIVGATRPAHLEDAIAALSVKLSPEQWAKLDASYTWNRSLGFHN